MSVIIGSARIDERGRASGGAAGDQKQGSSPDYKGEVSVQAFYVHSKGWNVICFKNPDHAVKFAEAMKRACNNANIGYSQSDRYGVVRNGTASKVKTNADCSSLVRVCFKEATGKDPGDFTTASAVSVLKATGLVDVVGKYTNGTTIYTGDILNTLTKGHIVGVVEGASRTSTQSKTTAKSIDEVAREVLAGKWGNGDDRRKRLAAAGYNYKEVQARVNALLK